MKYRIFVYSILFFLSTALFSNKQNLEAKQKKGDQSKSTKWGIGMSFSSHYNTFTEKLKTNYTNNISYSVGADIAYRKASIRVRDNIGTTKTKIDRTYNDVVWKKDSEASLSLLEMAFAYSFFDEKFFSLSSFLGIAAMAISPKQSNTDAKPEIDALSLGFSKAYLAGVSLDLKFGKDIISSIINSSVENKKIQIPKNYFFIRTTYTYIMPQFPKNFNGNMSSFSIALGFFSRGVVL